MQFDGSIMLLQDNRLKVSKMLPADDPVFEGHFPGLPIYPGVLLMELAIQAMGAYAAAEHSQARVALERIVSARYFAPLFPGQHMEMMIRIEQEGDAHLLADCTVLCGEQRTARLKMNFRLEQRMRGADDDGSFGNTQMVASQISDVAGRQSD